MKKKLVWPLFLHYVLTGRSPVRGEAVKPLFKIMKYNMLEYFTQAIDLIIIGLAGLIDADLHLILHKLSRMAVAADVANGEVDTFLDDHFIAAYICQVYFIRILKRA